MHTFYINELINCSVFSMFRIS